MIALWHSTPRSRAAEQSRKWQRRRAELLRAACTYIAEQIAGGIKVGRAVKEAARKFRNRSLGNGRQLGLSAKSMYRHWYEFRDHGESAFALRYVAGRRQDIDPLLLRLVIDASLRQSRTVSEILVQAGGGKRHDRACLRTIYLALPAKEIGQFLRAERRLLAQRKATERKLVAINSQLRDLRAATENKFLYSKGGAK